MWNIYLKRGTIWSVKSINQYEECYPGMGTGSYDVLILSNFTDPKGNEKFTYFKVRDSKRNNRIYNEVITDKNNCRYVEIENLLTGDQQSLQSYIESISNDKFNEIVKIAKDYLGLYIIKDKASKPKIEQETPQQRIYKYGIDVYVTENEHVSINAKKQIILSDEAKDDIIYNSKTEDQIRVLCDKYKIYPVKAIKEIRNRLVYQHKQNKG